MVFLPVLLNGFLSWFFSSPAAAGGGGSKKSLLGALYAAVAAGTLSLVPFTLVVLGPINRMLLARDAQARQARLRRRARRVLRDADEETVELAVTVGYLSGHGSPLSDDDEEAMLVGPDVENIAFEAAMADRETTLALVDKWGLMNLYRSAVSFLAGAAGLYAALS